MYATTSFGPEQKIDIKAYQDELTLSAYLVLKAEIIGKTEASFNQVTIASTADQLRQIADEIYRAFPVELKAVS
jgi:hypothetical protein